MSHFIPTETPALMCQPKSPNYSASPRGWSPAGLWNRGMWVSNSLTSLGLHLMLPSFHRWMGLIKPDTPVLSPAVPLGKTAGHLLSLCCATSLEGTHCSRKHTHDQRNRTTWKTCRCFGDSDLELMLLVTCILSSTPPGRRLHVSSHSCSWVGPPGRAPGTHVQTWIQSLPPAPACLLPVFPPPTQSINSILLGPPPPALTHVLLSVLPRLSVHPSPAPSSRADVCFLGSYRPESRAPLRPPAGGGIKGGSSGKDQRWLCVDQEQRAPTPWSC